MSSINRRLPKSNLSRELAIRQAHNKMSLVAPAGMPATLLTEIRALLQEVALLEISHEKFKRIRIMRTRLRIKDMNELYDFYEKVKLAAQIIYADKPDVAGAFG